MLKVCVNSKLKVCMRRLSKKLKKKKIDFGIIISNFSFEMSSLQIYHIIFLSRNIFIEFRIEQYPTEKS